MKTRILLVTICCLLSAVYSSYAQSWQWGKRGGDFESVGPYGTPDGVVDMATDKWGNVYVLSNVFGYSDDVDGHAETGYGFNDICIASFTCDGTYRWSKIIGAGDNDDGFAIRTDTLGGVYITGTLTGEIDYGHVHVDSDTVLAYTNKSMFLMKYDTGGVYKWFVMPQADTVSPGAVTYTGSKDMDVDGAGNISVLCILPPGAYAGGEYVTTAQGVYILKYNAAGTFTSGIHMDISITAAYPDTYGSALVGLRMAKDKVRDKYYLAGWYPNYYTGITYYFGSTLINHILYVGCFDNSGANVWTKQNTDSSGYGGVNNRPVIDGQGNIYLVGNTMDSFTFNGHAFPNVLGITGSTFPFLIKLDTNGNNIWALNGSTNSVSDGMGVALSGNTVAIAGDYPGTLVFGTHHLTSPSGTGYQFFLARFNAADGTVLGLDSLIGGAYAQSLTADGAGNFYLGGQFSGDLYVAADTMVNVGGEYDFCVAKYGYNNCGCIIPAASFTSTTGSPHVTFTYTGTTGEDSVRWTFGDGGTSTTLSPAHTYTASGTYTACVTVYTSCGSDSSCETITVAHVGVVSLPQGGVVWRVYPNPVADELVVEGAAEGTTVRLFNIMGQQVYRGMVAGNRQVVDTRDLTAGTYIIQLTDANGNRTSKSIVKQ